MINAYVPRKLNTVKEEIRKEHRNISDMPEVELNSDSFRRFITELCKLGNAAAKRRALTLSEREILEITQYIPGNSFRLDMANLFTIYRLRSSENTAKLLYKEWLNSYDNKDCNAFLKTLLVYDGRFLDVLGENCLSKEVFSSILDSRSIPSEFAERAYERKKEGVSYFDALKQYGMSPASRLYLDCELLYLTICDREDYLAYGAEKLLSIIQQPKFMRVFRTFLLNFLRKLLPSELRRFDRINAYCVAQTGEIKTEKFTKFFAGVEQNTIQKYINWINTLRIDLYFGNDDRSRFWRQYQFVRVIKRDKSNAVIMECEDDYCIEFLDVKKTGEQVYGPWYVYDRETFENHILHFINVDNHVELTQDLYHSMSKYKPHRDTHMGYWQGRFARYLEVYEIAEKLPK